MNVSQSFWNAISRRVAVATGAIALLASLVGTANAATLYVATTGDDNSSNPYNTSTPFYSLQKAVDWANAGDTIKLRGGTYKYTSGIWVGKNGRSDARITIRSYDNEWAVLDGSGVSGTNQLLGIGGSFVDVKWLEVKNSKAAGVMIWNGHDVTIYGCNIDNNNRQAIYLGADDYESDSQKNYNNRIEKCNVWNNVRVNKGTTRNEGWDSAITLNTRNNTVVDCNVNGNWGEGIGCYGRYNWVGRNRVHDNFSVDIYLNNAVGCTLDGNTVDGEFQTVYYRNGHASVGIQISNEASFNLLDNNVVKNNIVKDVWRGLYYWNGLVGGGMKNMDIYGNRFENCSDAVVLIESAGHSNTKIHDSTFIRNSSTVVSIPSNVSNYSNSYQ